jgi:hypothetical protein
MSLAAQTQQGVDRAELLRHRSRGWRACLLQGCMRFRRQVAFGLAAETHSTNDRPDFCFAQRKRASRGHQPARLDVVRTEHELGPCSDARSPNAIAIVSCYRPRRRSPPSAARHSVTAPATSSPSVRSRGLPARRARTDPTITTGEPAGHPRCSAGRMLANLRDVSIGETRRR